METEGNNNLSKAGSQYGVFSSLFYFIIMVNVSSILTMIAESNSSRLVLTGAWLDVAYFEDLLLFWILNKRIRYILTMRTLTHTLCSTPNQIWYGNIVQLEDTDVG